MSYTTYESYREKYSILLGHLQMDESSQNKYNDILGGGLYMEIREIAEDKY